MCFCDSLFINDIGPIRFFHRQDLTGGRDDGVVAIHSLDRALDLFFNGMRSLAASYL